MAAQFAVGGAVIPFVTLLLRDRGLGVGDISLILAASSSAMLVFPFIWGMLADRFIPLDRLFILLNLGACGSLALLARETSFAGQLVAFTLLTAFLNPNFMLVGALAFHHLPKPQEQFGKVRAWGSLGWIIPFLPISLWVAPGRSAKLDFVLYVGMAMGLVMAAVSWKLPHTAPGAWHRHPHGGHERYGPALRRLLTNGNYVTLLLAYFFLAGSFSLLTFYSLPLLEDLGVPRAWLGPAQAIGVVFEFALFQWQPVLLRRWNYTAVILAGALALLVRQWLYATISDVWVLSFSYVLVGAVVVLSFAGTSLLANALAGQEVRSTAQTLLVLAGSGLGPMFANWAGGRLSAVFGGSLRPVFAFSTVLAGLAVALLAWRGRRLNQAGHSRVPATAQ